MYHHGWAWAGDTPFQVDQAGGGSLRRHAHAYGRLVAQAHQAGCDTASAEFHHINDLAATVYDILGIDPPFAVDGFEQDPQDGVSMAYSFDDPQTAGQKKVQYFDIYGSRGVYQDGWFACTFGPREPWNRTGAKIKSWNPDEDVWELYNLNEDYSQANDLAEQMPAKLQAMKDTFTMQATENKVFPIGGAFYTSALHPEEIRSSALTEWTFFPGQTRIPESMAPKFVSGFSSLATIDADVPEGASGVLYCLGGMSGGFTVYFDAGELCAEYNTLGVYRYKIRSAGPVPTGKVRIEVEMAFEEKKPQAPAIVTLRVNGSQVGQGRVERSVPAGFSASETFDIGIDLGSPVSLDYHERAPFAFTGTIERIRFAYL